MDCDIKGIRLKSPCGRPDTASLRAGDRVLVDGTIVTARDLAHKHMAETRPSEVRAILKDAFVYHCGPVAVSREGRWHIVSAGPTTSIREEPYEAEIIREFGIRGVIGKGGMGASTRAALVECGGVYLHATGGAGAMLASSVAKVVDVLYLPEFGVPEAMWVLQVRDFPAIVTMDSTGTSIHDAVLKSSRGIRDGLLAR